MFNSIDIKSITLHVEVLILKFRQAAFLEYLNYTNAFFDSIYFLLDDKRVTLQNISNFLKRIYADNNDVKLHNDTSLPLVFLYIIFDNFRLFDLTKRFPTKYKVTNPKYTTKSVYIMERKFFRVYDGIAREGHDLKKHAYDEYKLIANKYGWNYIVNSDDNSL